MTAPVPIERKRSRGNPGKRALPAPEATISVSRIDPEPPAQLGERGAALYRVVRQAAPWVGASDAPLLVDLCELYDRREELKALIDADGYVLMTNTGYAYLNPAAGHLAQLDKTAHKLFTLLGLTPADRSRLGLAEVKAASKLEQLRTAREGRGA